MAIRLSREQFEALVEKALDSLPDDFAALLDNVAVMVEEEPSAEDLAEVGMEADEADDLFGLYQGVNLLERTAEYSALPDRVTIFRGPILRACGSRREVVREVRDTVIHELGHYFGMEEEQMPY
ncbi:MAG TPA: metallopeptidase family protein [Thermoanaerobaculia bacterium]|jgi:predicted Zn-dependent protease with MMP-like domain